MHFFLSKRKKKKEMKNTKLCLFILQSKPSVSKWSFGSGEGSWQGRGRVIKDRTGHLYNNSEMSDILVNACDENWWFGDTVKDFNAHKFLLGTASPVLLTFG